MGFQDLAMRDLQPDEKVTYTSRMSPVPLVQLSVLLVIMIIWDESLSTTNAVKAIPGLAIFLLILGLIRVSLQVSSTRFVVTSKRIRFQRGRFRRESRDVFAGQISGVSSRQGIVGRAFGYGAISITDTGGRVTKSDFIPKPGELEAAIHWLADQTRSAVNSSRTPAPPAHSSTVLPSTPSSPSAKFCGQCGGPIKDAARFCTNCGAPNV